MNGRLKKFCGFSFIVMVVVLVGISWFITRPQQKLKNLGYSADEVSLILEILDANELQPVLNTEYLPELIQILKPGSGLADFRAENLEKYIQLQKKYGFVPALTVMLANHPDYEEGEEYSEQKVNILYNEYYVAKNRARYFAFKKARSELDEDMIVALVNANRDRDFYTETEVANLENDDLLLVNKYYYLDPDFAVELIEQDIQYGNAGEKMEIETYTAFEQMFQAATQDGYQLYVTSGYRGYAEQEEVFASYLNEGNEAYALQYAAKPGYSEHQTGRAIDVFTPGETTKSFAQSPVAKWLAENAYKYGFILRYPEGKEDLTGYNYEPWHYRYVGREAAAEIQTRGITLEEYVAVFGN